MSPDADDGERGSAIVEFVFVAIVVFLPLVYLVAGFSAVQRGVFAADAAAREAGRAIGTAPDPVTGEARAEAAAALAVEDQSVDATDVRVAYLPAGSSAPRRTGLRTLAGARRGVQRLRHGDRPRTPAAGVRGREHRDRAVRRRARPVHRPLTERDAL
ncbi:hypothetical protein ACFQX8_28955 [Klenkia terrae]|uniref:hypothetical protein n=1 Tax=Klenkia terrae TaxID=1052259 RepID=UPI0036186C02